MKMGAAAIRATALKRNASCHRGGGAGGAGGGGGTKAVELALLGPGACFGEAALSALDARLYDEQKEWEKLQKGQKEQKGVPPGVPPVTRKKVLSERENEREEVLAVPYGVTVEARTRLRGLSIGRSDLVGWFDSSVCKH